MPLAGVKRGFAWVFTQPSTYDVGIAVFAAVVGYSSASLQYSQGHSRIRLVLAVATSAALILTWVKSGVSLRQAHRKDSPHELEGCLHALHSVLLATGSPDVILRLALHVPAGDDELEQITEYIGVPPKRGRIGRRFPASAGIIGRAYRENDPFVSYRVSDDYEEYVQELMKEWGYPEDLARLLNPSVMSWMAVPLYDPLRKKVEAVLYLDATRRDFFTETRQDLVLNAAAGIAVFIGKRYP